MNWNVSFGNILTIVVIVGSIIAVREADQIRIADMRSSQQLQGQNIEQLYKALQESRADQSTFQIEVRHGFNDFGNSLTALQLAIARGSKK